MARRLVLTGGSYASWVDTYSTLFNGVNQYINFGNNLGFARTDTFSFSFWVKPTSLTGSVPLLTKYQGTRGYYIIAVSGLLRFALVSATGNYIEASFGNISTGTWQHVVATYDGSSNVSGMNLYVNGVARTRTTIGNALSATIINASANFQAGGLSANSLFLNGRMDELLVSNTVLSGANAANIYNSGHPKNEASRSGLVLYNRMGDMVSGSTWTSVTGVNGTSVNGASQSTDVP